MKKVAVKASVFSALAITLMLHRAATKHIMITDAAGSHIDRGSNENAYNILIDRNVAEADSGKLIIPLSKTVSSDDIILEDNYIDQELRIYIDSREEGFYLDNAVLSDLSILQSAVCYEQNDTGSVCLDFRLNGFYANTSTLTEKSTIEVTFAKPSEMYDNIVVVDPAGNSQEVFDVALLLKDISSKDEDNNIKFYYTRLDGSADEQKSLSIVNGADPDLVVGIDICPDGMKTYYNSLFFLRKFNNADFADILLRDCAGKTGDKAEGVYEASEDDMVLMNSTVPSARISVDIQDKDDNYKRKLSEGIYQAILDGFKEME